MTTRETSRTAYQQLLKTGQIRGQQGKALANIVAFGPCTSGELFFEMGIKNVNAWRARITELQSRGLIAETGQRKCKITGRLALVWEYTGRLAPLPPKGRISTKDLRELIARAVVLIKREERAGSVVVSQWMASAKACGFKGT